jgi:hypothetical protein
MPARTDRAKSSAQRTRMPLARRAMISPPLYEARMRSLPIVVEMKGSRSIDVPHIVASVTQYSSNGSPGPRVALPLVSTGRTATSACIGNSGSPQKIVSLSRTTMKSASERASAQAAAKTRFAEPYSGQQVLRGSATYSTAMAANARRVASSTPRPGRGAKASMGERL